MHARTIAAVSIIVALGVVARAAEVHATCGDADDNGEVSVSDGVNVLRQAADLSSTCAADPSRCDVDGNGTVTVTDGVKVLRNAAGLGGALTCTEDGGGDVARFAGFYDGSYSGDDSGTFEVQISCQGHIEGLGSSSVFDEDFDIDGTVTAQGNLTFAAGFTTADATFAGTIGEDRRITGSWNDPVEHLKGTFRASRTSAFSCLTTGETLP